MKEGLAEKRRVPHSGGGDGRTQRRRRSSRGGGGGVEAAREDAGDNKDVNMRNGTGSY